MTKLIRPSEGRIIGGVCQGIANSLNLDPTVVRVVAALLILLAGSGFSWQVPDRSSTSSYGPSSPTRAADRVW